MNQFDDDLRRAASTLAREPLPPDLLDEALDEPPRFRGVAMGAVVASALILVVGAGVGIGRLTPAPAASASASASAAPSPTDQAAGPMTATTEEHGIRLTASLDRGRTSFGQRVWAAVTVENRSEQAVYWTGCGWPAMVSARPELPPEVKQTRAAWPVGMLLLRHDEDYTDLLYRDGRRHFVPEPMLNSASPFGCPPFGADIAELPDGPEVPVGASVKLRYAWDTDDYLGTRPFPGSYLVEVDFEFWPGELPSVPAETEPEGVTVTLPLVVEGRGSDSVGPFDAMDALLADTDFSAHVAEVPKDRWAGQDLGGTGIIELADDQWIVLLPFSVPSEPVGSQLVGVVDAHTGEVLDVRLESRGVDNGS
jgi:hypothetical protein